MTLLDGIVVVLFIVGAFLMFLASVGVLRLPDIFLRMSAATKASTLGAGFLLLGAALHFEELGITSRAIATVFFLFITAPVAAHRIARAAYFEGASLWDGTVLDELQGHYNRVTHELDSDLAEESLVEVEEQAGQTAG